MSKNIFRRPVWAALVVLAVLAIAFSFQPVRAFANSFLDLFRVQQITLLPMDMRSLRGPTGEPTMGQALGQLFSDSVQFTKKPGDPQEVASAAEASQLAGFTVRQWNGDQPVKTTVESGMAFNFTINRDQAQAVLDESGAQDLQLPASLDGVKISVDIPDGVSTTYGQCVAGRSADPSDPDDQALLRGENCITLLQVPSPSATTDPQIDPAEIAQLGLQFLGMSPDEAAKFSQSVDWASTLVIPIPRGDVTYQPVQVDGVSGNLITELDDKTSDTLPGYTILWVKDGVIYAVIGTASPDKGLEIANNLN